MRKFRSVPVSIWIQKKETSNCHQNWVALVAVPKGLETRDTPFLLLGALRDAFGPASISALPLTISDSSVQPQLPSLTCDALRSRLDSQCI